MSRASAFAEGTHPDRGFASVFVTAPDGLRLHIRKMRLPACLRRSAALADVVASPKTERAHSKCAGRPARSRWCKSTTMKE